MRIAPYKKEHFKNCIKIIQSNTPKYILPSEQFDYKNFLLKKNKRYFVFFKVNDLVACGGYGVNKTRTKAVLSWGLVHRKHHKKGYGTQLLKYRLNQIKKYHSDIEVCLDTSQHTYPFFEKFDFKIKSISKNGYGEGLDKYDMFLRLFE